MMHHKGLSRSVLVLTLFISSAVSVIADGLPGEYLMTTRWRDMFTSHSPVSNPAFMTEENYLSVRGAFAPILQGQFKLWELGAMYPIGLYQTAGVSVIGEDDGDLYGSKIENGVLVSDPNSVKTNQNYLIMLSYAYNFWSRLSAGVNLNFAYMSQFGDPVMGTGLDLGISYRVLRHSLYGDHVVGLTFKNLIAPSMAKSFVPKFNNPGEYSRDIKLTLLSNFWEHRLLSDLDVDIKDFLANAKEFQSEGVSAAKKIEFDLNYKIGAWLLQIFKVYMQFGFSERAFDYWGMALGVNVPSVNAGRDLEVLYQYNIMTEENNDASSHTIYARIDLGKHREELYARKMARLASLSPNELYNKARKLYSEQKYWDAFFVFSRILVEFPDFFKNDWVEYYRSSCQEELDMRVVSQNNYLNMKKNYPLSTAVPYTDLGLMRVYYRNGDFAQVTNQYIELSKPNVPDSLKFHGAYLMGQANLQSNDPQKAIQVLSIVPETHPDYVFAQHAIAIAHARANDDEAQVIAALENCIGTKTTTQAQKEIVNRSYVFLGYIFYEDNSLSKAVTALRMVPTTSYYAEDALLGQAWTALKARQFMDCISSGQLLTRTTNKDVVKCEGMLVQAYGYLLQKEYVPALQMLRDASSKIKSMNPPREDTLSYLRTQNESNRIAYNFLADKVEGLSMVGQNASQLSSADSMHTEQQSFVKKFTEFLKFNEEFGRTTFFSRNIDKVREDIEYALATVEKIAGKTDIQKEQQKLNTQQQQIDSEIEKLKKEMDQLQNSK
jgi:tetratricopeptide (TPR) repeat protein